MNGRRKKLLDSTKSMWSNGLLFQCSIKRAHMHSYTIQLNHFFRSMCIVYTSFFSQHVNHFSVSDLDQLQSTWYVRSTSNTHTQTYAVITWKTIWIYVIALMKRSPILNLSNRCYVFCCWHTILCIEHFSLWITLWNGNQLKYTTSELAQSICLNKLQ